jgi:hypothetical protein
MIPPCEKDSSLHVVFNPMMMMHFLNLILHRDEDSSLHVVFNPMMMMHFLNLILHGDEDSSLHCFKSVDTLIKIDPARGHRFFASRPR